MSDVTRIDGRKIERECKRDEVIEGYLTAARDILWDQLDDEEFSDLVNKDLGSYHLAITNIAAMIQKEEHKND